MRQLQAIISTAPGVRIEPDIGTPYSTGQSQNKICLFLDLAKMVETNVELVLSKHGSKRAERLAQWCNGRRINSYWRTHRIQLYQDIDRIKDDFDRYFR